MYLKFADKEAFEVYHDKLKKKFNNYSTIPIVSVTETTDGYFVKKNKLTDRVVDETIEVVEEITGEIIENGN